jgi:peptidoglycan/LPS O-acetylase OafA/YrhL
MATSPRLPYLDTARGLAAISVITWHCYTAVITNLETSNLYSTPFHIFWYGEADVIFFFIHSGFILSYSHQIFEKGISAFSYLSYILRRIFRIYPLFLFVLIISYLLKRTVYQDHSVNYLNPHFTKFWSNTVNIDGVVSQGVLAVRIPDDPDLRLIPQDWTLTVEVLLCPLIPFINYFNRKLRIFSWLLILVWLKLLHLNTYLFEFAVGVSLFSFRHQISSIWNNTPMYVKSIFFVLAVLLYSCCFEFTNLFNGTSRAFTPGVDRFIVVTGCVLFFIFILHSKRIQVVLNFPVFVKIGKICYSLYVNHIFLLICFSGTLMIILHHFIKGPNWLIVLMFVLVVQTINILISLVTYNLIEKSFNKWGKSFSLYFTVLLQKRIGKISTLRK